MSYTVQHKRSDTVDRRPLPTEMEDGQVAINFHNDSPGMFFRTSTGKLVKAGPPIISSSAPIAGDLVNYQDFSVGELWVNSSTGAMAYWSGMQWVPIATSDLSLSNEGMQNEVDGTWGSYVIQEGEDDLFLLNKRNGKKYKFMLQEVS